MATITSAAPIHSQPSSTVVNDDDLYSIISDSTTTSSHSSTFVPNDYIVNGNARRNDDGFGSASATEDKRDIKKDKSAMITTDSIMVHDDNNEMEGISALSPKDNNIEDDPCDAIIDDESKINSGISGTTTTGDTIIMEKIQTAKTGTTSVMDDDDDDDDDELECISAVSSNDDIEEDTYNYDDKDNISNCNIKRVNSCFFSVTSGYSRSSFNDLRGFVIEEEQPQTMTTAAGCSPGNNVKDKAMELENDEHDFNVADILYHDIMVNIISFLPLSSLAAFSATARRPNFECFYFLQLQLERALGMYSIEQCSSSSFPIIRGSGAITRLSRIDPQLAKSLVDEYLESNSSLRNMPLSQRLAYLRHSVWHAPSARNAMLVLLGGACASYMGGEMPSGAGQALLSVGLGSAALMKAAATSTAKRPSCSSVPSATTTTTPSHDTPGAGSSSETAAVACTPATTGNDGGSGGDNNTHDTAMLLHPPSSNPYTHCTCPDASCPLHDNSTRTPSRTPLQKPTGCVGAYLRTTQSALLEVTRRVKQSRAERFRAKSDEERRQICTAFIDACANDADFGRVRRIVHDEGIDVDGFFIGSDGTEACGLHIAAFNGASAIIEYLCAPVDEFDPEKDGGLCNVNIRDDNGWTACHFAAGSNSVECVRLLAAGGARLTMEAGNGYTPYHWAERLSNKEVMKCLEELGADKRFLELRR
eukprot:CAMPEP_0172492202 /NCGR_PEP_ID=MMETSP1066-20121228/23256_1 /TAXON_ID=671091 /ORGANISM="Coscinodiscus wailesii, Strain CCMP2513" /LENGTH=703 /DNA_ID=CAMNT_0013261677 /DNA_START=127 /DNA_END=2235 /DNA_ORIENTATION=+